MKQAATLADVGSFDPQSNDVFNLEAAYEAMVFNLPRETVERQGYFHPSAVAMCPRKSVYEFNEAAVGAGHGAQDQDRFDVGHAVHDLIQSRFDNLHASLYPAYSVVWNREVKYDQATDELFNLYGVGGTTDGVLEITRNSDGLVQRGIVEIKSSRVEDYDAIIKADKANEKHLKQATIYAYRFNCPIIWIVYVCKNNSKIKFFTYSFDPDVMKSIFEYYSNLLLHIAEGTLPEREQDWFMCPRCEYAEICQPPKIAVLRKKKASRVTSSLKGKNSPWAS